MKLQEEYQIQQVKLKLRLILLDQQGKWISFMSFGDKHDANNTIKEMLKEVDKMIAITRVLLKDLNLNKPESEELKLLLTLRKGIDQENKHPGNTQITKIIHVLIEKIEKLENKELQIIIEELKKHGIDIEKQFQSIDQRNQEKLNQLRSRGGQRSGFGTWLSLGSDNRN